MPKEETHSLTKVVFDTIQGHLAAKGLLLKEGTIVDATIIAAPPSTKKGNERYFGMKAHIGVDADSGLVHTVVTTAANVNDVTQGHALLHGEETHALGDAGYNGVTRREENQPSRIGQIQWQRHKPDRLNRHRLAGWRNSIRCPRFMVSHPTPQQIGIEPIVQCHRSNRHIWVHACPDCLGLERRAMPPAPYRFDFLVLFHGVHVFTQVLVDTRLSRHCASLQDGIATRLHFIQRYCSLIAVKRSLKKMSIYRNVLAFECWADSNDCQAAMASLLHANMPFQLLEFDRTNPYLL